MGFEIFAALALVFVLEGILPFVSPQKWRKIMTSFATQEDKMIRRMGLASMILGLVLLTVVHQFL